MFEDLQTGQLTEGSIRHLIFVMSGNDPTSALEKHVASPFPDIERDLVGLVVDDHSDFIRILYESI